MPVETASRLIAFHIVVSEAGVKVAAVGLMVRLDFLNKKHLVRETKEYLKKSADSNVGPRHIQSHDFYAHDPAHLNARVRKSVRALLLNIIKKKFHL